jgi:foldase protein PrsA
MKKLALVALALALGLALLVAAGCGNKVPQGAIATVGGVPITKAQFDQYINQAKASAGQSGQAAFPSAGTTAYNRYAAEIVNYLVEQQVVLNGADKQKIAVTDADVQTQLQQIAAQYGGTAKMYAAAQKAGMDQAQLKTYVKNSLLGQKLYQQVIGTTTPTEAQMQAYYKANKATFNQKATRTVRHILVKTQAEALKVRALLAANDTTANWAKVAKKYSTDTGTKNSGGSLGPITPGQMVKPFDTAAFSLKVKTISAPVKSQYGWHVLEVTAITPAKKSTYASAKATIKSTLTSQAQQKTWQDWLTKATKAAEIKYAAGYNPTELTPSPSASPSPSSTK